MKSVSVPVARTQQTTLLQTALFAPEVRSLNGRNQLSGFAFPMAASLDQCPPLAGRVSDKAPSVFKQIKLSQPHVTIMVNGKPDLKSQGLKTSHGFSASGKLV